MKVSLLAAVLSWAIVSTWANKEATFLEEIKSLKDEVDELKEQMQTLRDEVKSLTDNEEKTEGPRWYDSGPCGSDLHFHSVTKDSSSHGFSHICSISRTIEDRNRVNIPCKDLLKNLPGGYRDAEELLQAGGNFGCVSGDWQNAEKACQEDHQQEEVLMNCDLHYCPHLYVCVKMPPKHTAPTDKRCGSLLHTHEGHPGSGYDVMCYLEVPERDASLYNTACEQLLVDLAGGLDTSQDLLAAGGNFGCMVDVSVIGRWRACRDDHAHSLKFITCAKCTNLFVCIRYPEGSLTTPVPPVVPQGEPASNECGSLLHVHQGAPAEGYSVMCYLHVPEDDPTLYDMTCAELLRNLPGGFKSSQDLLDAGGNFGCRVSSDGVWDLSRRRACKENLRHSARLRDGDKGATLFVCLRYPPLAEKVVRAAAPGEDATS